MKKFLLICLAALFVFNVQAQDDKAALAVLKEELETKKAAAAAAAADVDAVKAKIDALPGWRYGGVGILGLDFKGARQWFSNEVPSSASNGLSFALTGFAHNIQDKYFWRNDGNLNIGGLRFQAQDSTGTDIGEKQNMQIVTDVVQVSSLFGYRLTEKIAISALGELRTVAIGNSLKKDVPDSLRTGFFNPGYIDFGVGVTWTPIKNLVVVLHPLNYNLVIPSGDYTSSLGLKFKANYTQALPMGVAWTSDLSGFMSYKDNSPGPSLSNWTWVNGVSFTAFKGIGVSAQLGLRKNNQEAFNIGKLAADNNPLQSYYVVGLSYSL